MKNYFLFLLIGFLLVFPIGANAGIIGTVTLAEGYDPDDTGQFIFPGSGKQDVYLNYTVTVGEDTYAAFCVNNVRSDGAANDYTLLSIDKGLKDFGLNVDDFFRISVIAEKYYDADKEAAQIAIWEIMFGSKINLYGARFKYKEGVSPDTINDARDYLSTVAELDYVENFSSNWVLAVNSAISSDGTVSLKKAQNYIFRASDPAVPVSANPEPSTLLLLGTGLIGMAGFGRNRLIK